MSINWCGVFQVNDTTLVGWPIDSFWKFSSSSIKKKEKKTRNNGYKLEVKTHTTNTLGNSFNYRVVKIWNSLPSEVVASETLGTFKSRLDEVFENSFKTDWNYRV